MITLSVLYLIAYAFIIYKWLTFKERYGSMTKAEIDVSTIFATLPILIVLIILTAKYLP